MKALTSPVVCLYVCIYWLATKLPQWGQTQNWKTEHLNICAKMNLHFFFSRYLNKGRCAKMNLHFYLFQKAKHLKRRFERIFQL